jgi:hypothetical protein
VFGFRSAHFGAADNPGRRPAPLGRHRLTAIHQPATGRWRLRPSVSRGVGPVRLSRRGMAWKRSSCIGIVNIVTPPRGTVCPSDRLPFDPEFGQPVN